jgi:hypothetical protein
VAEQIAHAGWMGRFPSSDPDHRSFARGSATFPTND